MTRIVPMPSFTDPHNPAAAGGSINFGTANNFPSFEAHPVTHASDYGMGLGEAVDAVPDGSGEDDRSEWTKNQWADLAESYDLSTSGTKPELIARVEEYEAALDNERSGQ